MSTASTATPTTKKIQQTWRPLLELATREVFEIMLATELGECPQPEPARSTEFTAMVGLAGQLCGVFSIHTTVNAASLMASKMLGIPPEETGQESWDAVGEIANMVAGNFKAKLSGMGSHCMLSVPTLITGADYHLHSLAKGETIGATFLFEQEVVRVTLELHS